MKKKTLCMLLMLLLVLSLVPLLGTQAEAATNGHSRADAVNWALAQNGKGLDYDNYKGNQCVDLIKYYYDYLGCAEYARGNANEYAWNALPPGWTRVYGNYQPGDVAVFKPSHQTFNERGSLVVETTADGHVSIITAVNGNWYNSMDQNALGHPYVEPMSYPLDSLECAIRPDFETLANLPSDYYGYLAQVNPVVHVTANGDNVELASRNQCIPKQIWHYVKQADGSYEISNEYDGRLLDVMGAGTEAGTNVQLFPDHDHNAQRWFIYDNGDGSYGLRPAHCDLMLDVTGGATNAAGTNIEIWTRNGTDAQRFTPYIISQDGITYIKPAKPSASVVSTQKAIAKQNTMIEWSESPLVNRWDERSYELKITSPSGSVSTIKTANTSVTYQFAESGNYTVSVNSVNNLYKDYYTVGKSTVIQVQPQLRITSQPQDVFTPVIKNVRFTVVAEGEGLTYQWQISKDGNSWSNIGSDSNTILFAVNSSDDGKRFRCIVTDATGNSVTSNAAKITIVPAITRQPQDATGRLGEKLKFSIGATGIDLTYKWQYSTDGGKTWNASSSTSDTATCTLVSGRDGWLYRCTVTDSRGKSLVSNTAKVHILPTITAQPKNASGKVGDVLKFTIAASGDGLTYKWQYSTDGGKTWKASSSTSTTATCTLSTADRDGWLYRCIVSSRSGAAVTSSTATVTVKPAITAQPKNAVGTLGQKVQFTISATGKGLTYKWQYSTDGGKTWKASSSTSKTATCTLSGAERNGWLYRCIVKDSHGATVTSSTAKVIIKTALKITSQPKYYIGSVGDVAKFTVKATGDGLKYKWQYSTDEGKTWKASSSTSATATCTLTSASRDGWIYRCIITDQYGESVISDYARVIIG